MSGNWLGNPNKDINIRAAERRKYALQLRSTGIPYREVVAQMISRFSREGLPSTYDERYAYRDVKFEMDRLRAETMESANDIRLLELERLDMLQTAVLPEALSGNLKAVDRILAIMRHRALLMGLNAPNRTEVEVKDWRTEIIDLIKTGKITVSQAEEELGKDIVAQLLNAGSSDVIEGRYTEAEGASE